jgi:hypothetical protein
VQNHQEAYKAAYDEKKIDKQQALIRKDIAVIVFDLQQCFPPHTYERMLHFTSDNYGRLI